MQADFSFPKLSDNPVCSVKWADSVLIPVLFTSEKNCKGTFSAALALIYKAWMTSGSYCSSGNINISILGWSRGNMLYLICVIMELSHHLSHISQKWKKNLTGGMPHVICMTALLHIRIIIFFLIQRENKRGNKRKNYLGIYWWLSDRENKLQQVSLFSCKQSNHFNIRTSKALQRTPHCSARTWLLL